MNLSSFQNEVNHLIFLYFTAIGVIQRDANKENIQAEMDALLAEIVKCRTSLYLYLDKLDSDQVPSLEHESIIEDARAFIDDGLHLIDKVTSRKTEDAF